jgi:hypothetical protein
MSWYTRPGDQNAEEFKKDQNRDAPWKFKVMPGEKKRALFIADERFGVWEHRIPIIGKNGTKTYELVTCSRNGDCYLCALGGKDIGYSMYAEYSTVLDLTPWVTKEGVQKKYSRRAFRAVKTAIGVLNRKRQLKGQKDEKGDFILTGYMLECFRDSEKSSSCGNDFEVIGERHDLTKLPTDVVLYDFEKELAPLGTHSLKSKLALFQTDPSYQKRDQLQSSPLSPTGLWTPSSAIPVDNNDDIPF